MLKRRMGYLTLSCLMSLGFLVGCANNQDSTSSPTPNQETPPAPSASESIIIKIATQSPLSGEVSAIGTELKQGAEMAVKDYAPKFKEAGFELQLLPKDDKADPATGTTNAKALTTDQDVLAVVGHLNSGVMAASGTSYEQAGLAVVSPANTNPQLTENGWKTYHRIVARDDAQGPAASQYLFDQGVKTVYIVNDSTDYGKGIAMEMEKKAKELGIEIKTHEGVNSQEMEFNTLVTKIMASKPDAVYFGGMYAQAGQFLKQLKDKGFNGYFVGGDGVDSAEFIKAAGGAENVKKARITSVAGDLMSSAKGPEFAQKYKQMFNQEPGAFSVYGYDAALVVINGIEKAMKENGGQKPTREQVNAAISATADFQGILTITTFDEKGDNKNSSVFIKSFEKGTYPAEQIAEIKKN